MALGAQNKVDKALVLVCKMLLNVNGYVALLGQGVFVPPSLISLFDLIKQGFYSTLTMYLLLSFSILMFTLSARILFEGEASALQSPQPAVQSLFRRLLPGVQTLPDGHSQGPS